MKKSLLVLALAVALVFAFAGSAFAVGPFLTQSVMNGSDYPGYVSWTWVSNNTTGNGASPHGAYATTTNKCQVCHSVHRADPDGIALTAINGDLTTADKIDNYGEACTFCHRSSSTFAISKVNTAADGSISPHGDCGRCHVGSPHGMGASQYDVLSARLINTKADAAITYDTTNSINGLVPADATAAGMFMNSVDYQALTLGTGYLCAGCHSTVGAIPGDSTGHLAFAVNEPAGVPSYEYSGAFSTGHQTGHRVWAAASTNWNQPGGTITGAYYTGGGVAVGDQSQVSFNPVGVAGSVTGCKSCHDAQVGTTYAFPHGYANSVETAYAPKSEIGSSLVWLSVASNASGSDRVLLGADVAIDNIQLSKDGLCIKCHISADGNSGVGLTY